MKTNNRYTALMSLFAGLLIFFHSTSLAGQFAGGQGTEDAPFLIETEEHLYNIRNYKEAHFRQVSDIDLIGYSEEDGWEPLDGFEGVYSGNGYSIVNLVIKRPNTNNVGLFGSTKNATLAGIRLVDVSITGFDNTGGLIGYSEGSNVGMSYVTGEITGNSNVGGLIGTHEQGNIEECYSSLTVYGNENAGGLIGRFINGSIENCYSEGEITGDLNTGGLLGFFETESIVTKSYAIAHVSGIVNTGGLIGYGNGSVSNSYWNIETSSQSISAGGEGRTTNDLTYPYSPDTYQEWDFIYKWREALNGVITGYPILKRSPHFDIQPQLIGEGTLNNPFEIYTAVDLDEMRLSPHSNYIQMANIDLGVAPWNSGIGWAPVGNWGVGFTGSFNGNDYVISNLYINRPQEVGIGLFGYAYGAFFPGIHLEEVDVTGYLTVGSLVGSTSVNNTNENTVVEKCHSTGMVTGDCCIGGLVGTNDCIIEKSFSVVNVAGINNAGGLVGANAGTVLHSYSLGDVEGSLRVGGLVGTNGNDGLIQESYSIGKVEGETLAGGLVGYALPNSVIDSYWDIVTSGLNYSAEGSGAMTVQMVLDNTMYSNWDFQGCWAMTDYTTYPYLQWQTEPGTYNYPPHGYHKTYHRRKYYWESFPVLWNRDNYGCQSGQQVLDPLTLELDDMQVEHIVDGIMIWNGWQWLAPHIDFHSTHGYKLKLADQEEYELIVQGETGTPENEPFGSLMTVYHNRESWLGYFIPQKQDVFDAFGDDVMEQLVSIRGENWSMHRVYEEVPERSQWITAYDPHYAGGTVLEYGKMYIVGTRDSVVDNFEFAWNVPDQLYSSPAKPKAEFFVYDEKAEYESFFIEDIIDDDDVVEVAVYAGDECVGASVFLGGYPLEILAYTDESHLNEEINFVIHRDGNRGEVERIRVPEVMDTGSGEYSSRVLRPLRRKFYIIRLGAGNEEIETIVNPEMTLSQNYPNPITFKETSRSNLTEIPFYVSQDREVTLTIYNIRGQQVKTLFSGTAPAGKHYIGWNGLNDSNRRVGSGVYFYRLESGDKTITRKMLIVR